MKLDAARWNSLARRLDLWDWGMWFGFGGWAAYQFLANGNFMLGLLGGLFLTAGG